MEIIVISAITATSSMTLFSAILSHLFNQQYNEPQLLQIMMSKFDIRLNQHDKTIAAWLLHYSIGLVFVVVFHCIIFTISPVDIWLTGLLFGTIIGCIGIMTCHVMFSLKGKPSRTNLVGYYSQLFVTHIIFALTVVGIYQLH